MVISVSLALALILGTSVLHFGVLRWLSGDMASIVMRRATRLIVMIVVMLSAHLIEVGMYALVYGLAVKILAIGSFGGRAVTSPLDYFYFSIVTFTSLGLGDVYPQSHLRFVAGVETLNGLLLIAWSGSFIYIAMSRLWSWRPCAEPGCEPRSDRVNASDRTPGIPDSAANSGRIGRRTASADVDSEALS